MSQDSKESLLLAAKNGDFAAVSELVQLYRPYLLSVLHARFPSLNGTCEDVVQMIPFKLRRHGIPPELTVERLPAYLVKIAKNTAVSDYRQHERFGQYDEATTDRAVTPSPEGDIIRQDLVDKVNKLIAALPPKSRNAVEAFLIYGQHQDAARMLGCPVQTFWDRYQRAIDRLSNALGVKKEKTSKTL